MGDTVTQVYNIVSPTLTVKALRDSGYKSTAHALAELIDNAIEAGADDVEVFAVEERTAVGAQIRQRIQRIAVLDNGSGMSAEILRRSLRFGDGTRRERRGIGRFGMGLPSSSMSQCRKVDVWSWTNGPENAFHTQLHIKDIEGGLEEVPEPVHDPVPDYWKNLSEGLGPTGTLVLWEDLDRVQWRGARSTLLNTEFLIGRMYRRFLCDGRVRIRLVPVRDDKPDQPFDARPNDPLHMMAPSLTPEPFHDVAMFMPFGASNVGEVGVQKFSITVESGTYEVIVRATYATPEARRSDLESSFWPEEHVNKLPGATPWGKHVKKNIGISIMRAERELHLDTSWVIDYDPVERWWGVEVEFPPQLDEVFGVTNNKQAATTFTALAHFAWEDEQGEGENSFDVRRRMEEEGDARLPLMEVANYIHDLLPKLRDRLEAQTRGTGKNRKRHDVATAKADEVVKRRQQEGHSDLTSDLEKDKTPQEIIDTQLQNLTETHQMSREDAQRFIDDSKNGDRRVRMFASRQDSEAFFNVEALPAMLQVALNTDHPVYAHLISALEVDDPEKLDKAALIERLEKAADGFKVLLYAWAQYENESPRGPVRTQVMRARREWGTMAAQFLDGPDLA